GQEARGWYPRPQRTHPTGRRVAPSVSTSGAWAGAPPAKARPLRGPPMSRTADQAEMEKLARQFWPSVKEGEPTEAWVYPSGWRIYIKDKTVVDITQYGNY